jgi:hypothetical protein
MRSAIFFRMGPGNGDGYGTGFGTYARQTVGKPVSRLLASLVTQAAT